MEAILIESILRETVGSDGHNLWCEITAVLSDKPIVDIGVTRLDRWN